jgi:peptidyl-prolyl cis-trans isomerase C
MIRTSLPAILLSLLLPWQTFAQAPAPQTPMISTESKTVVATVNGQAITAGEVATFYQNLPPQYQQIPMAEIYQQLIERLVDQKLVADAARKGGLADRPDVKARLEMVREGILNQIYMEEKMQAAITEDNLRNGYRKMVALEPKREEIRARHILVKTREEAMVIIGQISKGADFATLAKDKSTGPSGRNGGDLGFFSEGQMVPPFSKAAFALKKGEVTTEPVQTQFGWHVIKLEERRVSGSRRYEDVVDELRQKMTDEVFEKEVQKLRAGAKIDIKGTGGSKIQPIR